MLGFTSPPRAMGVPTGAGVPPANLSSPVLGGSFFVGRVLTSGTGLWSGFPTMFEYRWQNNGTDNGQTTDAYTVVSADDGDTLRCLVRAGNAAGWSGWVSSNEVTGIQLALWLDASDLTTIAHTMGSVTQWDDKSGNARHVVQPTGANQPLTGAGTMGGKNIIRFNGTSAFLYNTAPFMYDAGAVTIIMAHNISPTLGSTIIGEASTLSMIPAYWIYNLASVNGQEGNMRTFVRNDANAVVTDKYIQTNATNSQAVVSGIVDTGSAIYSFANGILSPSSAGRPYTRSGTMTLNSFCIAANRRSVVGGFITGDMAEIIVCPAVLAHEQVNAIGNYLTNKWGAVWSDIS